MKYRVITGTLKARTALHVGSGEANELADSLLRRDAQGGIVVPGTAIAGALRAMLTRLAPRLGGGVCLALLPEDVRRKREQQGERGCDCAVCRLFGDVDPNDEEGSTSAASRLLVFDARPAADSLSAPFVRDGVGIARASGAAARAVGAKFALEALPAGACFHLRMELREPPDAGTDELAEDERLLALALAEWRQERAHLGGDVARGLGAFRLKDVRYHERDLDTVDGLVAFLASDHPWEHEATGSDEEEDPRQDVTKRLAGSMQGAAIQDVETVREQARDHFEAYGLAGDDLECLPIRTGWAEWAFTLQAEGPLLSHDTASAGASGFDHAPLLARMGDWTHPLLPGSGLRGVLRSQAERIARTLVTHRTLEEHPGEDEGQQREGYFLARCPACDPLARRARPGGSPVALECCDSLLQETGHNTNQEIEPGKLCLACQLFGSTRRGSRLLVEDAPYTHPDGDLPTYKMLDFLAIDRFSGGGAEHLKFDALALWRPAFEARLFLDDPQEWELGWLALALRDLAEGWLRVGFGAAKGFGQVTITGGTFRRATLEPGKAGKGEWPSIYRVEEHALDGWAWAADWVQAFVTRVGAFEREALLELLPPDRRPSDSFFGVVDDVYGGEAR
jgi:CRISPR/Cas system CSM-associated protein Csm3 (group 7 of RAMP superfamily)